MDWQTIIAAGIVVLTLVVFLARFVRPKTKGGCGHSCGCGKSSKSDDLPGKM